MSNEASRERYIKAAERYAAADRTDPFTLARALTHIRTNVCGYVERGGEMSDALYDAVPRSEMRTSPTGEVYPVIVYGNMVRP